MKLPTKEANAPFKTSAWVYGIRKKEKSPNTPINETDNEMSKSNQKMIHLLMYLIFIRREKKCCKLI